MLVFKDGNQEFVQYKCSDE